MSSNSPQPTAAARDAANPQHHKQRSPLVSLLKGLGSLRLTVALLTIALVVVLVATLQQTRADISRVKHEHFFNPVVSVPFQVLLPPAWFPNSQDVHGSFMMPSGVTVIVALMINLIAAHLFRFRIQARGGRLVAGIGMTVLGAVLTVAVIATGNAKGFQEVPWVSYSTLWKLLQVGLGAVLLASLYGIFSLAKERRIEKTLLAVVAAVCAPLLGYLLFLGEKSFIGDDAMRVVWRLMQGMGAAVVTYLGCALLFKRKAGIVVIHAGILMLMIGEMYTTYSATEQRMKLEEGGSSQFTFNIEAVEFAVISTNDDGTERVVVVPAGNLKKLGTFADERLPFQIRTIRFFENSALEQIEPSAPNLATRGIGRFVKARPIGVKKGTDTNQVADIAAAYVQLLSTDSSADLGTFLVSQSLYLNPSFDLDTVVVDGQTYQIGLRFKHYYKPYTIDLIDTNRTNYVGTMTPRTYSSEFRLNDHVSGVTAVKKISMNNPLRYNNETFYQSGHDIVDGKEYSVLQIVQNTGWMIPYVCCSFVGFGLLVHFLSSFSSFLEKLNRRLEDRQFVASSRWTVAVVVGLELLFIMAAAREMMPKKTELEGMRLDRLGRLPVVYGGRVQPLDSLARTALRQMRKREYATDIKGDKVPAMRWIADVMFDATDVRIDEHGIQSYRDYRIFRIDHPEVLSVTGLRRRKGHLYSLAEIEKQPEELRRISKEAKAIARDDPSRLTDFQKKAVALTDHMDMVYSIRYSFGNPDSPNVSSPIESIAFVNLVTQAGGVPLAVPYEQCDEGWVPMSRYLAWNWLGQMADEHGLKSVPEIAQHIAHDVLAEDLRAQVVKREISEQFIGDEKLSELGLSTAELRNMVDRIIDSPPPQIKDALDQFLEQIEPTVDAIVARQVDRVATSLTAQIKNVLGPEEESIFVGPVLERYQALADLQPAYDARDAATFNRVVEEHLRNVTSDTSADFDSGKVSWEVFHNQFSPFTLATAIYIAALLIGLLSWCGVSAFPVFSVATRRAAFWIAMLALVVHTVGLITRIYISGRPPVTNLYASAIFIGWLGVLLGLSVEWITRIGLGTMLASIGGFLTLFIAYSLAIDGDTFSVLVAVLDTQFWLATHVVCITIGYAATFFAAFLGFVYVIGALFTPSMNKKYRSEVIQLCYGITCFALLFSFVGTVLGGLWADDSWGRFWGWDSKENGALMIVLANAILLHARWAGIIRDKGIALVAIFGSIVTIWSWFAVNELGIGLHSYGFSEGRMVWVSVAWGVHALFLLAAFVPHKYWWSIRREQDSGKIV